MIEGHRFELTRRGFDEALLAEAETGAEQACQSLDVAFSFVVDDIDAVAAGDHVRPGFLMHGQVRVGVDEALLVESVEGIRTVVHVRLHRQPEFGSGDHVDILGAPGHVAFGNAFEPARIGAGDPHADWLRAELSDDEQVVAVVDRAVDLQRLASVL